MRIYIMFFLFVCFSRDLKGQTWEAGLFGGASGYMGDLEHIKPYHFTNAAFGALVKRNFDGHWSAKLSFLNGRIKGNDADSENFYQQERNLNFQSDISEISLQMEVNLFKYLPGMLPGYGNRKLSPFIFTGVSGFKFNPKTSFDGTQIELQPYATEGVEYKTLAISIPYGIGVKYNIKGNWNLIGEIGYRTAFTDYMDDLSGRYPDLTALSPASRELSDRTLNGTAESGLQRGDFRKRDTYMISGISLTYTFVSVKCPTF